ncbi:MAG: LysE family translocator [Ignavibacteriaceae bacterium]
MNGIIDFPLFIITSAILIVVPGPDFIYVTTRGISEGHKAGVLSALGISIGLLVHTLFAALGLSAIIQASWLAYQVVKYAGACYLIYLGVKTILAKNSSASAEIKSYKNGSIFTQGVLTNVFNPKAIVTFIALLPQFVDPKIHNHGLQFIFLGIILSLTAILWFSFVGYFAGIVGGHIKRNKLIQSGIKYLSGSVMAALGLRLVIKGE